MAEAQFGKNCATSLIKRKQNSYRSGSLSLSLISLTCFGYVLMISDMNEVSRSPMKDSLPDALPDRMAVRP